jgi:hypothetical protein
MLLRQHGLIDGSRVQTVRIEVAEEPGNEAQ